MFDSESLWVFHGTSIGVILLMALVNVYHYVISREKFILYYILFQLFSASMWIRNIWLFDDLEPNFDLPVNSIIIYTTLLGFDITWGLFIQHFFKTKKTSPGIHITASVYIYFLLPGALLFGIIWQDLFLGLQIHRAISFAAVLTILGFSINMTIKKYAGAFYFMLANLLLVIGTIVTLLANLYIIPLSLYTFFAIQIGSALDAVIFYFGILSLLKFHKDRINKNQRAIINSSKLNHHFLFNALESIRTYIKKHPDQVSEYIDSYEHVMTHYENMCSQHYVNLQDEIDFLKAYLLIESRNRKVPFSYEFIVSENINTKKVKIPSLVIQPLLENVIKHSFHPEQKQDHIKVTINSSKKGSIECSISDNGAGQKKEAPKSLYKNKSMGLELIEERMRLLSKQSYPSRKNILFKEYSDNNPIGHSTIIVINYQ